MKTFNWPKIKNVLYLLMIIFVVGTTVACAEKKSKSSGVNRFERGPGGQNDTYIDPQTGQAVQSDWGAISHAGNNVLYDFMNGAELGTVSTSTNAETGIRFRGRARQGSSIEILVWDSIAQQNGGLAYHWAMEVVNVQGGLNQGGASVTVRDATGTVTFDGPIEGSVWRGTVYYKNGNNQERQLGTFQITASSVL